MHILGCNKTEKGSETFYEVFCKNSNGEILKVCGSIDRNHDSTGIPYVDISPIFKVPKLSYEMVNYSDQFPRDDIRLIGFSHGRPKVKYSCSAFFIDTINGRFLITSRLKEKREKNV